MTLSRAAVRPLDTSAEVKATTLSRSPSPQKLRICIISANLPPLYTGGGQQAVTLGAAFHHLGHEVLFLTKRHNGLPASDHIGPLEVQRVTYETERGAGLVTTIPQVWGLCRRLIALRRRYDVVLFFNPEGGFHHSSVVIPVLHLLGKKSATRMTLVGANDPAALRGKPFSWFRLMPYWLHHRVISISTALSVSFQSVFGSDRRLVYIPNGVDLARYHPRPDAERAGARVALGLDPRVRYCVFVGRICHRKGIDLLIEAWRHVVTARPDARLLLVGPEFDEFRRATKDDFAERLRETIRRDGLGPFITWVGRTDAPERYLQVSDLFVFPSRREGCPNALLEAMACGLPIVSTRIPDITEDLITSGIHGIVTPQEPAALGAAVVRVLSDQKLARTLGQQAYRRAADEFAIDLTARKYLDVLESL